MTKQTVLGLSWLTTLIAVIASAFFSGYLVEFVYFAVRIASNRPELRSGELSLTFRVTVSLILQTTILATIVRMNGYRITKYFGIVTPSMRAIILALTILAVIFLLSYAPGIRGTGPAILLSDIQSVQEAREAGIVPLLVAVIVFVIPCCEELIFRGFLFRGLENSRIGVTGAILVTAIFWSASHLPNDVYFIFLVFVFGLLFGWLRVRTQSILLTSLLHGGMNLMFMISAYSQLQAGAA